MSNRPPRLEKRLHNSFSTPVNSNVNSQKRGLIRYSSIFLTLGKLWGKISRRGNDQI